MEAVTRRDDGGGGEATPQRTRTTGSDAGWRERLDGIVESLLFAAGTPLALKQHGRRPRRADGEGDQGRARAPDGGSTTGPGAAFTLHAVAGGFQLRSAPENAEWVRALLRERPARLGRAALETLAIIAYKQPATRAEIEAVRGVDCDSAITTLLARRLIKIAGRKEAVGRPLHVRDHAGVSRGVRPQRPEPTAGAEGNRSGAGAGR